MDHLELLRQLNACHAPSGNEGEICALLRQLAEPFADDVTVDALGNLIVHKKGDGPRLLFAAHMDSLGLVVTHIEDGGQLCVGQLGGLSLPSILHTPFRFQNGTMGLLSLREKIKTKDMTLADLYLDIGASDRTAAEALVQIGDTAVSALPAFAMGEQLVSPYLDNRISCLILLEALRRLDHCPNDLYFVFTVQEEVGLRGAQTAAFQIDPAVGIAVDVTGADELDSLHEGSSKLGSGAAIKVMDTSVIAHPDVVRHLADLSRQQAIPHQRDVLLRGGTDAGAMHKSRSGVPSGGISIPCRYIHTGVESVHTGDVEACTRLVCAVAASPLPETLCKR